MQICTTIDAVRESVRHARSEGKTIGLVPTMGALHAGHLSLIERCRERADFIVVSLFVNPLQFGPGEDYDRYPREEDADQAKLESVATDVLFIPAVAEIYPEGETMRVSVGRMAKALCGASRPGHFDGVVTVCAKLFNIVQPDVACFGQKDAQQLVILRRYVRDFNVPLHVMGCPTVREPDGLAMSSRNQYLAAKERKSAVSIFQALELGQRLVDDGERDPTSILQAVEDFIQMNSSAEIDYVAMVDPETLDDVVEIVGGEILAVAAKFGRARLIDNIIVETPDDEA